jgi:hypothetical protein
MIFQRPSREEYIEPFLEYIETMPDELRALDLVDLGLWKALDYAFSNRNKRLNGIPSEKRGWHVYFKKQDVIDWVLKNGLLHPIDKKNIERRRANQDKNLFSTKLRKIWESGVSLERLAKDIGISLGSLRKTVFLQEGDFQPGVAERIRKYLENHK